MNSQTDETEADKQTRLLNEFNEAVQKSFDENPDVKTRMQALIQHVKDARQAGLKQDTPTLAFTWAHKAARESAESDRSASAVASLYSDLASSKTD